MCIHRINDTPDPYHFRLLLRAEDRTYDSTRLSREYRNLIHPLLDQVYDKDGINLTDTREWWVLESKALNTGQRESTSHFRLADIIAYLQAVGYSKQQSTSKRFVFELIRQN